MRLDGTSTEAVSFAGARSRDGCAVRYDMFMFTSYNGVVLGHRASAVDPNRREWVASPGASQTMRGIRRKTCRDQSNVAQSRFFWALLI
jgi:hypothetical protein